MGSFSPEAVQEILGAAYDEVLNRRNPEIYDRYLTPWRTFLEARLKKIGGYGGKVIQKLQRKDSSRSIKHYSHRDVANGHRVLRWRRDGIRPGPKL